MLDRSPVIVGVAQSTARSDDVEHAREPLALMADVARLALDDAHAAGIAGAIDAVRVVNIFSASYRDPAGALAERLGLATGERLYTTIGGDTPQWLVNRTADDLAAGRVRAVLIAGAEAMYTLRKAAKRRVALAWGERGGRAHDVRVVGDPRLGSHPDEWRHGVQLPVQVYPLFEIALRAATRERPAAHRERIAALSASFARVAATNPHAWFRDGKTAAEIGTVTAENRLVAYPYPKFMNALLDVDQAAALVMTTAATARALGVPAERCVHLHGGGEAHDLWYMRDRVDFHSSPAMTLAFEQALGQAEIAPARLGPVDLYSCFPVAPQFAARILGFPVDGSRPLTVTGGLPYFGGPGNNYGTHAIATMVERLRADPGALGLVSGLGWFMTKHAVGVYGTAPPPRPWSRTDRETAQAQIAELPHPQPVESATGPARIETYSVLHDREGAACDAIVVARLPDERRAFALLAPDLQAFAALEREEMVGAPGRLSADAEGRNRFTLAGG